MDYYVARDRNGCCYLYEDKPIECIDGVWEANQCRFFEISPRLFPEVTFENSPMKVKVKVELF